MPSILIIAIITAASWGEAPAKGAEISGAAGIIDGDTIRLDQVKIRFSGMDAPEMRSRCVGVDGDCGAAATRALAGMMKRRRIVCVSQGYMSYDRVVAVCYAGAGREDLGESMVAAGWAKAVPRFSKDYLDEEQSARRARLGIWAAGADAP